jgi:hypothetical protein
MNDDAIGPDRAEEDILTYEVSDEELERAGTGAVPTMGIGCTVKKPGPC